MRHLWFNSQGLLKTGIIFGIGLAVILGVVALICLVAGCGSTFAPPSDPSPTSDSIASAEANRVSALGDVKEARPHSNRLGKSHIDRATTNLTDQGEALELARKQNAANMKGWAKTVGERNKAREALGEEHGQFFSKRQRDLFWWILTITVGTWLLAGVAGIFLPGAVGRSILNLLPFANIFSYFARKRNPTVSAD
jgi:hypothetical protein